MKLALVGPIFPYRGGIAHYTALLAGQLSLTHTVRVYSYRQQYPNWLFPGRSQYDSSSAPLVQVEARHWLTPWWPLTWIKVKREWDNWRPDAVIIQWWVPFMAAMTADLTHSAHRMNSRVVMLCHNVLPHERNPLDIALVRWALCQADGLVLHNTRDEAQARILLPDRNMRVVPHPSYTAFHSTNWRRESARAAIGVDGYVLLFFGFIRPYKGLLDLLEALPTIGLDVTLLVVGEIWGPAEPYRVRVKTLGLEKQVRFVDSYVSNDEAAMFFTAADLVVLPYREATGSGVLQMAFGLGVPVVATKAGGMDEAVDDGITGFLVEPGDVQGLGQAIRRFFVEDRSEAFRASIQRQEARFSWAAVADAALSFMEHSNASS